MTASFLIMAPDSVNHARLSFETATDNGWMGFPPARCEMRLRFPVELPGGTINSVNIDLDRPGRADGGLGEISRIVGLPASLICELVESDYVRILVKIDELNRPRLATMGRS